MSIYKECSAACRRLAQRGEPFIDFDVVNEAGRDEWSNANWRDAQRHANQIMGTEYRAGKLVRYGPVVVEGEKDFVRKAGRVVYADPDTGPEAITTPNGAFPRYIHTREDDVSRVGRRKGTGRDDYTAWGEQNSEAVRETNAMTVDARPLQREIARLKADLRAASKRNDELVAEINHLRNGNGKSSNGDGDGKAGIEEVILKMLEDLGVTDLESRLKWLEDREKARSQVYTEARA